MTTATPDSRKRRISTAFNSMDGSGKGRLGPQDVDRVVDELASNLGVDPRSADAEAFRRGARHLHASLNKKLGRPESTEITEEDYVRAAESMSTAEIRAMVDPYVDGLFELIDTDDDGAITAEEFAYHQAALGIDQDRATEAFESLDSNGDGKLGKEEFRKYGRQFYQDTASDSAADNLTGRV